MMFCIKMKIKFHTFFTRNNKISSRSLYGGLYTYCYVCLISICRCDSFVHFMSFIAHLHQIYWHALNGNWKSVSMKERLLTFIFYLTVVSHFQILLLEQQQSWPLSNRNAVSRYLQTKN